MLDGWVREKRGGSEGLGDWGGGGSEAEVVKLSVRALTAFESQPTTYILKQTLVQKNRRCRRFT